MSSLDNFPSYNGPHRNHPTLGDRLRVVQQGLFSSVPRDWDLASAVPMAPVQPPDSACRTGAGAHPDPRVTERLSHRSMKAYLVPTSPRVYARRGDTIDGIQLMDTGAQSRGLLSHWMSGNTRARVRTYSRFHPYMR